ncbi:response regulator [Spirosoma aerophilum]
MQKQPPILFIDDDEDDQLLMKPMLEAVAPGYPLFFFKSGQAALDFLQSTHERPFLIISEVTMQRMSGLELRQKIEQDPVLRKRAIPFIFFTAPVYRHMVEEAYELTIQGFFEKQTNLTDMHNQLKAIISYWESCLHPNRFVDLL